VLMVPREEWEAAEYLTEVIDTRPPSGAEGRAGAKGEAAELEGNEEG